MTLSISECLSNKSFSRFGYRVLIRNETSQTQFVKSELILIKELKENGLVLEIPPNVCQKGHSLTLFFLSSNADSKIKLPNTGRLKEAIFEVVAKIEKVEVIKGCNDKIVVEIAFVQYEAVHWKKILNLYSENQEKINQVITSQHIVREDNE